ncbi:amino acid/amide ABC transporter substrate-binding protein, HAAT family [Streptosporangium subroseum]|uniref:Amino acid/amide ABC transporter substrate-binding protein, HAAT family n=1 Tax=Streptosporangium subroseum TaxID=106412 RepID=A0A239ISH0_9ACTN|nr:ABC transporter substrate-binding protein [Streptosporangium subroseum]SNS96521.1 amino acid/amide ABC transporter substrate-binding protein, HAAT family [Streptosporangium subroseum]
MRAGIGRLRLGACLSLSGRHARFGTQARLGLEIWQSSNDTAELVIEDDQSRPEVMETAMRRLAPRCDLMLGPYSTHLMRRAGQVAASLDRLIWNHGGSGDDVEAAHPGHVVSVPTPTSQYAKPFIRHLDSAAEPLHLWIVQGKGGFGRQVAAGAETTAHSLGIHTVRLGPGEPLPSAPPAAWALFCAGSFEEDVETVNRARALPRPPRTVCAVAAGVREFGDAIDDPRGIYGVGQWFPGSGHGAELGPAEPGFLAAYEDRAGVLPDYPAAQAAATAAIAAHCARLTGGTTREALWAAASALETTTLFGSFKIDPGSGVQVGHQAALVRWGTDGPVSP